MNSRGKPLSDFETFKARFESFMAKHTNVDKEFAKKLMENGLMCSGICATMYALNQKRTIRIITETTPMT